MILSVRNAEALVGAFQSCAVFVLFALLKILCVRVSGKIRREIAEAERKRREEEERKQREEAEAKERERKRLADEERARKEGALLLSQRCICI